MISTTFLLCILGGVLLKTEAHFHPFDPYAPHDSNNGYPQHFCDLNDDEYGRPYLGPYDQHVDASARNPFPKVPPPDIYTPPSVATRQPTQPTSEYKTLPAPLKDLLGRNVKLQDAESGASEFNDNKHDAQFTKRQNPPLPGCTVLNECAATNQRCTGSGTQYDTCERRCTCVNRVLTNCCRVRKEWRSLTQTERCRYINAVVTVSTQPQYRPCYNSLVNLHTNFFGQGIHGMPFFFPWHRWYILQLENLLRKVNCRITVPYWDWSLESQGWQNSIIWSATCGFGGNGNQNTNGLLVTTGPFSPPTWTQPDGSPLSRNFNNVLPDCAAVALAQRVGVNQYLTWHTGVESNLHNGVHCNIGGTMCTSRSANDPIFFLHHGFIDKLWSDWQSKGSAYKNLAYFSMNTNAMPGAFGATPSVVYDLQNQPGCVKVCIQQPTMACCTNTTYTPVCPRDMNDLHYSPLKLSRLIHRPYPKPSEEAFKLFHATYEDRVVAKRFANLMNDYKQLDTVINDSGYTNEMLKLSQASNGFVDFERYLYRPQIFQNNMRASDVPKTCYPYLYGQA